MPAAISSAANPRIGANDIIFEVFDAFYSGGVHEVQTVRDRFFGAYARSRRSLFCSVQIIGEIPMRSQCVGYVMS